MTLFLGRRPCAPKYFLAHDTHQRLGLLSEKRLGKEIGGREPAFDVEAVRHTYAVGAFLDGPKPHVGREVIPRDVAERDLVRRGFFDLQEQANTLGEE